MGNGIFLVMGNAGSISSTVNFKLGLKGTLNAKS